jgi:glycosyl hydrolase family 59/glycosyl hydrolase family 59 (putative galactocerebrosidase)
MRRRTRVIRAAAAAGLFIPVAAGAALAAGPARPGGVAWPGRVVQTAAAAGPSGVSGPGVAGPGGMAAPGGAVPPGDGTGTGADPGQAPPPAPAAVPVTSITVSGNASGPRFGGVGAVLGGGGTARYLDDYPAAQRASILDYLFKPGYGASLQLLKLEIGGDVNSSDGAEPSIEHTRGHINCAAGYEFDIARQAVAINPKLKLYGLQWGAPGWVGHNGSLFTSADIGYLLDWLGCAKRLGLNVSYLGGWNEGDDGSHAAWFGSLRSALDSHGYRGVRLVAADSAGSPRWPYPSAKAVAILGDHDNCGHATGQDGARTVCSVRTAARRSGKPLWGSELGGMDADARHGCTVPCAPAMDRAFTREFIDAGVTGALEWPALISMPSVVLPYENRGLVTASQPWSGSYQVNAMTWAVAQVTQFAWPPSASNPAGWHFVRSASGYLRGNRRNGSYVTLVRGARDQWSTIIETTAGVSAAQRASFHVTGGRGLAGKTVHVWASNFSFSGGSSGWFVRQRDIKPKGGRFSLTIRPGFVYSLTTTTGQGKAHAARPAARGFPLPYRNGLSSGADGLPALLASQDGSFELAPCRAPDGATSCAVQEAAGPPVWWRPPVTAGRHPYAITGGDWARYKVGVDVMLPKSGSVGLIGRFHSVSPARGTFDGYLLNVSTSGNFRLQVIRGGKAAATRPSAVTPGTTTQLASGRVPFPAGTWHRLTLSMSGSAIAAGVDGRQVASVTDSSLKRGLAGITVGGWYPAAFSHLVVTAP